MTKATSSRSSVPRSVLRYDRQAVHCPGGGKKGYRTKRKARRLAERWESISGIPLYVYRCPNCNLWHLTSQEQRSAAA